MKEMEEYVCKKYKIQNLMPVDELNSKLPVVETRDLWTGRHGNSNCLNYSTDETQKGCPPPLPKAISMRQRLPKSRKHLPSKPRRSREGKGQEETMFPGGLPC